MINSLLTNSQTHNEILSTLSDTKIRFLQLDPFGFCNSKCWFCPVKYLKNPEKGKVTMSIDLLKSILDMIDEEKSLSDGIISPSMNFAYTAHYNEVLLYKHFEVLCAEFANHGISQMILSNGFTLTPDKTDILIKYSKHICGVCLNIPAFNAKDWSIRTGFLESGFDKLISNVRYAIDNGVQLSIQVNGLDIYSTTTVTRGPNAPVFDIRWDLAYQVSEAKKLFPEVNVFTQNHLVDRIGLLPTDVLNNTKYLDSIKKSAVSDQPKQVIGCSNTFDNGKGRPFDWLHINAVGEVILCCNDYNFDYVIGDLSKNKLRDFWVTSDHADMIESAYQNICTNCTSAVFA